MIVNHWAVMPAGTLRAALLKRDCKMDMGTVWKVLLLLTNRELTLCAYLAGEDGPKLTAANLGEKR
jgi:hypothetical protein